jgi:hypothetical protein
MHERVGSSYIRACDRVITLLSYSPRWLLIYLVT